MRRLFSAPEPESHRSCEDLTLSGKGRKNKETSAIRVCAALLASEPVKAMAEEEEVDKYKRLFEEQKARVKDLERQNAQLKVSVLCSTRSHLFLSILERVVALCCFAAAGEVCFFCV